MTRSVPVLDPNIDLVSATPVALANGKSGPRSTAGF